MKRAVLWSAIAALGVFGYGESAQAAGCPAGNGKVFTDVDAGSSFCTFVTWMAEHGITGGCATTANPNELLYCPNDSATRLQLAAFMKRLSDDIVPHD